MFPVSARRLGAALALVAAAAAVTATGARADAPRNLTITPVHGTSTTGITASFSFKAATKIDCTGQPVLFTWDGAAWASDARPAYIGGNHTCSGTINATPPSGTGGGPHTVAATGGAGHDTASTTFLDDDPPAAPPAPAATPAPAGPTAPPTTGAPTPTATPAPPPASPSPSPSPSDTPSPSRSPCAGTDGVCAASLPAPPQGPPSFGAGPGRFVLLGALLFVLCGGLGVEWYVRSRPRLPLPVHSAERLSGQASSDHS